MENNKKSKKDNKDWKHLDGFLHMKAKHLKATQIEEGLDHKGEYDDWCHYSGMPSPSAYEERKMKQKWTMVKYTVYLGIFCIVSMWIYALLLS